MSTVTRSNMIKCDDSPAFLDQDPPFVTRTPSIPVMVDTIRHKSKSDDSSAFRDQDTPDPCDC